MFGITPENIETAAARELREIERRAAAYRGGLAPPTLTNRTVILVDDGLATGATMLAAVRATRQENPSRIIVAVPVGPLESCSLLSGEADEVICLSMPAPFFAVGQWYDDFEQTSDEEVVQHLRDARQRQEALTTRAMPLPGDNDSSGMPSGGAPP
jgi:putative phosphoribosyl transferase